MTPSEVLRAHAKKLDELAQGYNRDGADHHAMASNAFAARDSLQRERDACDNIADALDAIARGNGIIVTNIGSVELKPGEPARYPPISAFAGPWPSPAGAKVGDISDDLT